MTTAMLLILVAAIAGLAFYVTRQPDVFRVTRSAVINAPADAIFPWMNNPRRAAEWSPFVRNDPDAAYTYEGPESGVGAITTWDGKKSGAGKLTITDQTVNERVTMRLEFYRPMKCVNTVDYILTAVDGGTDVLWTMYGPNNIMGKLMGLFMNCEKMCGDQFIIGLNNLKQKVEGA